MDPEKNPILRAVSFLENCEPASNPYYPVKLIVSEEIQSMYAEGKDAKTTAEIINNRVQTYLNEQ